MLSSEWRYNPGPLSELTAGTASLDFLRVRLDLSFGNSHCLARVGGTHMMCVNFQGGVSMHISSIWRWASACEFLLEQENVYEKPENRSIKLTLYLFLFNDVGKAPETSTTRFAYTKGGLSVTCICYTFIYVVYSLTSLYRLIEENFGWIHSYVWSMHMWPNCAW